MSILRLPVCLSLVFVLAVAFATPVRADDVEEETEALELRIEFLIDEIELLAKAGHDEAAELLEKRVRALRKELAELREEEPDDEEAVEEVIELIFEALRGAAEDDGDREAVGTLVEALRELARAVEEGVDEAEDDAREDDDEDDVHPEIVRARARLATMHLAFKAFLEAGRRDAAHKLGQAIRALEVALEGRRDEEAREVRQAAPELGEQVELLERAAELYEEWGHRRRADRVAALARELAQNGRRRGGAALVEMERELAEKYLKAMKMALRIVKTTEREGVVETLQRGIHALDLQLKGRTDEKARRLLEHAPPRAHVIEILLFAAHLYEKAGHDEQAAYVRQVGETLLEKHREGARRDHDETRKHLDELQDQVRALLEMTRRLHEQIEDLEGEIEER